jgi:hypothetical protein
MECLRQEGQWRETKPPIQLQQGLLSAEPAQPECGQMTVALRLVTSMRECGQEPRQGAWFEVGNGCGIPVRLRLPLTTTDPSAACR